eukprot:2975103-Prymnesium_polylepis.1
METYRFSFDAVRQQHGKVVQLQEIILRSADGALLPIIDARNPGAFVAAAVCHSGRPESNRPHTHTTLVQKAKGATRYALMHRWLNSPRPDAIPSHRRRRAIQIVQVARSPNAVDAGTA